MQKDMMSLVRPYVIGLVIATVLTLTAYALVVGEFLAGVWLLGSIALLAAVQLVVQLVFFLHLGRGKDAHWNLAIFFFMLLVLVIIVGGSLWIMYNMNYNMMSPEQMDAYMKEQGGKGF